MRIKISPKPRYSSHFIVHEDKPFPQGIFRDIKCISFLSLWQKYPTKSTSKEKELILTQSFRGFNPKSLLASSRQIMMVGSGWRCNGLASWRAGGRGNRRENMPEGSLLLLLLLFSGLHLTGWHCPLSRWVFPSILLSHAPVNSGKSSQKLLESARYSSIK